MKNLTVKKLQSFFEQEGFNVHLFKQDGKQCAEVEKWTAGGVDMNIVLMPFTADQFTKWIDDFDIDDEIDAHRKDKLYKANFRISESVEDFTDFRNGLVNVSAKLLLLTQ